MKIKYNYNKAFTVAVEYLEKKDGTVFSIDDVLKEVYSKAGTIYIAPGRTVKDWIEDLVDLGYITKKGIDKYIISNKRYIDKLYKGVQRKKTAMLS